MFDESYLFIVFVVVVVVRRRWYCSGAGVRSDEEMRRGALSRSCVASLNVGISSIIFRSINHVGINIVSCG